MWSSILYQCDAVYMQISNSEYIMCYADTYVYIVPIYCLYYDGNVSIGKYVNSTTLAQ